MKTGGVRITAEAVKRLGVLWLTPHGRLLAHFAALDGEPNSHDTPEASS